MIQTALTKLLGISHPILLAPMDVVADARLTAAVSDAGGLGVLGGGYGGENRAARGLDLLKPSRARLRGGLLSWGMGEAPGRVGPVLGTKPGRGVPFLP